MLSYKSAVLPQNIIVWNKCTFFFNLMCNRRWMSMEQFSYLLERILIADSSFYRNLVRQTHLSFFLVISHICSFLADSNRYLQYIMSARRSLICLISQFALFCILGDIWCQFDRSCIVIYQIYHVF